MGGMLKLRFDWYIIQETIEEQWRVKYQLQHTSDLRDHESVVRNLREFPRNIHVCAR